MRDASSSILVPGNGGIRSLASSLFTQGPLSFLSFLPFASLYLYKLGMSTNNNKRGNNNNMPRRGCAYIRAPRCRDAVADVRHAFLEHIPLDAFFLVDTVAHSVRGPRRPSKSDAVAMATGGSGAVGRPLRAPESAPPGGAPFARGEFCARASFHLAADSITEVVPTGKQRGPL